MSFENKYPYTDFHELNLDWFLKKFKTVMDEWAEMQEDFHTLEGTVQQFTDFVTNYFDNLDVQQEINHKLDEMAADGSLSALIQPLFDTYKAQVDADIELQHQVLANQNADIAVLKTRMDGFSHLAEGSTTGDAELMDIRITWEGLEFDTAGDAVREQVKEWAQIVKDELYSTPFKPVFTNGKYMQDVSNVATEVTVNAAHYTKMPIFPGTIIKLHSSVNPAATYPLFIVTDTSNAIVSKYMAEDNLYHDSMIYSDITGFLYVNVVNVNNATFSVWYPPMQEDIENVRNSVSRYTNAGTWTTEKYYNIVSNVAVLTTNAYTSCMIFDVTRGDSYLVTNYGNGTMVDVLFTDNDLNVIYQYTDTVHTGQFKTFLEIAPITGKMIVNTFQVANASVKKRTFTGFSITDYVLEKDDPTNILMLGDSQTQRTGYPEKFITEVDPAYTVRHYGHGGGTSYDIAYLYGSIQLYVDPVTIPATTTAVEITLRDDVRGVINDISAFCLQTLQGVNKCTIDGIEGSLSVTYDAGYTNVKYFFTRTNSGNADVITRPVPLKTMCSNFDNQVLTVWVGTNDSYHKTDVQAVFEQIKTNVDTMINKNNTNRFIVMGLTSKAYMTDYADVNVKLANYYGYHFLDLASYILKYGLEDENITPTAQDLIDIANGEMPDSLRDDAVHFNSYGYDVIGNLLYIRGCELGYWE